MRSTRLRLMIAALVVLIGLGLLLIRSPGPAAVDDDSAAAADDDDRSADDDGSGSRQALRADPPGGLHPRRLGSLLNLCPLGVIEADPPHLLPVLNGGATWPALGGGFGGGGLGAFHGFRITHFGPPVKG